MITEQEQEQEQEQAEVTADEFTPKDDYTPLSIAPEGLSLSAETSKNPFKEERDEQQYQQY